MSVDQSWAQLCAFSEGIPHHVTTTLASQAGGLRGGHYVRNDFKAQLDVEIFRFCS